MKSLQRILLGPVLALACAGALAQAVSTPVPIYDSTQIPFDRYTVMKRIWVEGWRSAFWIPGHRDEAGAQHALLSEAGRLGADGVINMKCLDQTDSLFKRRGYYCYGNAIRLKNEVRVIK